MFVKQNIYFLPFLMDLCQIIFSELKQTEKQQWWVGRPMNVRVHLGAYLLQQQFNFMDRQTEQSIRDNAAYQVFCGRGLVRPKSANDDNSLKKHSKIPIKLSEMA